MTMIFNSPDALMNMSLQVGQNGTNKNGQVGNILD